MLNEVLRGGGGLGPAVTCNCLGRGRGGAGGQGWKVASCWLSVTRRDTWHVTLTTADGRQCVVTSYCKLLSSLSQSFTPPPVYTRRNIYNGHHSHFVITSYKIYAAIEMFNKRIVWWSLVKYNINNWPSTFCLFTFNIYFIVCVDNIYLMLSEVEVCYFLCPVCMNECIEQHPLPCGQPPQCTQPSEYGPAAHLSLLSPRHSPPLSTSAARHSAAPPVAVFAFYKFMAFSLGLLVLKTLNFRPFQNICSLCCVCIWIRFCETLCMKIFCKTHFHFSFSFWKFKYA